MLTSAGRAMRLAKCVTSGNQSNDLGVVHAHSAKRLAYVEGRCDWVTVAIGTLGVDVDEAHVSGSKRLLQSSGTRGKVNAAVVTNIVTFGHEGCLSTPENALI